MNGDAVVALVEQARAAGLPSARQESWYPEMPPTLPGEQDGRGVVLEAYERRLLHPTHGPFNHRRHPECATGRHPEDLSPDGCECPCHAEQAEDPSKSWTGSHEVVETFARAHMLPEATVRRIFDVTERLLRLGVQLHLGDVRGELIMDYNSPVSPEFARRVCEALRKVAERRGSSAEAVVWSTAAVTDDAVRDPIGRPADVAQFGRAVPERLAILQNEAAAGAGPEAPAPVHDYLSGVEDALQASLHGYHSAVLSRHARWTGVAVVIGAAVLAGAALTAMLTLDRGWWMPVGGVGLLMALMLLVLNAFVLGERSMLKVWKAALLQAGLRAELVEAASDPKSGSLPIRLVSDGNRSRRKG